MGTPYRKHDIEESRSLIEVMEHRTRSRRWLATYVVAFVLGAILGPVLLVCILMAFSTEGDDVGPIALGILVVGAAFAGSIGGLTLVLALHLVDVARRGLARSRGASLPSGGVGRAIDGLVPRGPFSE